VYADWPEDVVAAFQEFKQGGIRFQEANESNEKWNKLLGNLHAPAYYIPDPTQEPDAWRPEARPVLKDERAKELVSHLMELLYDWGDENKFREVFPKCVALLDRVITHGTEPRRTW
jgi:hypothetical protein